MNHVMPPQAFLQVGLSFATVDFFVNQTLKARRRFYLPQEPLSVGLKKFWSEYGTPQKLTVCSRYLEKILDAKLGGTVAQVVTSGFETWPILRQPVMPLRFDAKPYRQEPLASQELIFGLSERLNSDGKVLHDLDMAQLDAINAKLKLMGVKRVCINLLFAHKNPAHQAQAQHYFLEQGFEVFCFPREAHSLDEMPAWRKNVINACLSGGFSEHVEDIKKSFGEETIDIHFLNDEGHEFLEDKSHITGSLFAWTRVLQEKYKAQADMILNLDLENWFLMHTTNTHHFWESPWGPIEVRCPVTHRLRLQPAQELTAGHWGGLMFADNELGFEPGPICFGRAHKLTMFDTLQDHFEFPFPQVQTAGARRYKDQLNALIKHNPQLEKLRPSQVTELLIEEIVTQISIEVQFKAQSRCRLIVDGFFGPLLFPLLKKKLAGFEMMPAEPTP